jgi:hypothetical protein
MVFGRSFESALVADFHREDPTAALFKEWGGYRDVPFEYKKGSPGTVWSSRECSCSKSSLRTIAFGLPSRRKICR